MNPQTCQHCGGALDAKPEDSLITKHAVYRSRRLAAEDAHNVFMAAVKVSSTEELDALMEVTGMYS